MNFILKVTKRCNLRCSYCYEFDNLTASNYWSLEQVRVIFKRILAYYRSFEKPPEINLIWHGGEPMILGARYFGVIKRLQEDLFGSQSRINNSIQTNLAVLNEDFIPLLMTFFKNRLGVSFDVYGDNRKFADGTPTADKVLSNLQKLIDNKIPFSIISVLSKQNLKKLDDIYDFFKSNNIDFAILPVVKGRSSSKKERISLTVEEFTEAMVNLYDKWINDTDCSITVSNFQDIIGKLMWKDMAKTSCCFSKVCQLGNILINTDGNVYPCSDLYEETFCYGNIFSDDVEKILNSPKRKKLMQRYAFIEQKEDCRDCRYLSLCAGGCMYEAKRQGDLFKKSSWCYYYKSMFSIVEDSLISRSLLDNNGNSLISRATIKEYICTKTV